MPNQEKQITLHLRLVIKKPRLYHLLDFSVTGGQIENHNTGIKQNSIQLSLRSLAVFNLGGEQERGAWKKHHYRLKLPQQGIAEI